MARLSPRRARGAICVACTFTSANSAATKNAFNARQSSETTRATTDHKQGKRRSIVGLVLVQVGIERDRERDVREVLHETASIDRHVAFVRDVSLHLEQPDDDLGREVELARRNRVLREAIAPERRVRADAERLRQLYL